MESVKIFDKNKEKRDIFFLIISAISLIISFFHLSIFSVDAAWVAIIFCGIPILKDAAIGLFTKFDIKADLLVSLALVASIFIGEIFAAGEIAFIMAVGSLLEERTGAKARAGIEKLIHLTPMTARVINDGVESVISAEKVQIGDKLRVLAGETIAVDGIIVSGQTSIDQSVMTGESLPIDKEVGDEVFSGTVNQFGPFDMKAVRVGQDSSLQRMIRLVKSADADKAEIVGIADRWATWIVVIALMSAVITWFFTKEIIRSVTILVVFCPCALILATPTAIMAGIGNAAAHGILVKEGDALERLAKVTRIAFDKTGTLTYGRPFVVDIVSFKKDITPDELLSLAASAELRSEHPLGKTVVKYFKSKFNTLPQEPSSFQIIAGHGVSAKICNQTIISGNEQLLKECSIDIPQEILSAAEKYKNNGCTIIYVAIDNWVAGIIAFSDILRNNLAVTIESINKIGVKSLLLTGDNEQAANHIAKTAGIPDVYANCLPEDKMLAIEQYQKKNEFICMIGDGINDALALKKAYIGIAMGSIGSDIAIDAADIALVNDNIDSIPYLLLLSRKVMKTIKINLTFSMGLNFVSIILAMAGILNPVIGALLHNAGSVLVVINSSLLLKWRNK